MRVGMALLAVVVMAFAPAPFPKPRREVPGITLERFQGKWRVLKLEGIDANGKFYTIGWSIDAVRVEGAQWTFLQKDDVENAKYVLVIDPAKKPAHIDFYSGTKRQDGVGPYMLGLIKREGNVVKILYYSTSADKRATSFEQPPANWWLLTLEKLN